MNLGPVPDPIYDQDDPERVAAVETGQVWRDNATGSTVTIAGPMANKQGAWAVSGESAGFSVVTTAQLRTDYTRSA